MPKLNHSHAQIQTISSKTLRTVLLKTSDFPTHWYICVPPYIKRGVFLYIYIYIYIYIYMHAYTPPFQYDKVRAIIAAKPWSNLDLYACALPEKFVHKCIYAHIYARKLTCVPQKGAWLYPETYVCQAELAMFHKRSFCIMCCKNGTFTWQRTISMERAMELKPASYSAIWHEGS